MGKKEKSTRHKKTTTKQTNLAATYQGVLDIAKSGMGFVMVPNMENDILVFCYDFLREKLIFFFCSFFLC